MCAALTNGLFVGPAFLRTVNQWPQPVPGCVHVWVWMCMVNEILNLMPIQKRLIKCYTLPVALNHPLSSSQEELHRRPGVDEMCTGLEACTSSRLPVCGYVYQYFSVAPTNLPPLLFDPKASQANRLIHVTPMQLAIC